MEALTFRLDLRSSDVVAALAAAPDVVGREIVPAMMEAELLLERAVRDRTPTSGAGTLANSIGALPVVVTETAVIGDVGTALAYAQPVETGSRPHRPPVEPIADWVRRKLGKHPDEAKGIAWGIAGKIAKEGSIGVHMFEKGLAATQTQILEILGAGVDRALGRIGR